MLLGQALCLEKCYDSSLCLIKCVQSAVHSRKDLEVAQGGKQKMTSEWKAMGFGTSRQTKLDIQKQLEHYSCIGLACALPQSLKRRNIERNLENTTNYNKMKLSAK